MCGVCQVNVWSVLSECVECVWMCGVCRVNVWSVSSECVECVEWMCGVYIWACIPGTETFKWSVYFYFWQPHPTHTHAHMHTRTCMHAHARTHTHVYAHTLTRISTETHTIFKFVYSQTSLTTHLYFHPSVTVPRDGTDEVVGAGGERGDGGTVVHTGLSPLVKRGDREITGIKYFLRHLCIYADQSHFQLQVFSFYLKALSAKCRSSKRRREKKTLHPGGIWTWNMCRTFRPQSNDQNSDQLHIIIIIIINYLISNLTAC